LREIATMVSIIRYQLNPAIISSNQHHQTEKNSKMAGKNIDYSLYLVTDSTPEILGSRDLIKVVEDAITGGVTCVQLRDKTSTTDELIAIAKRLHDVTKRLGVPLLVNDRVDVAAAVKCEGVHVGQDDTGRYFPPLDPFIWLRGSLDM